ncbi:hypothetical protein [Rubrivirga sp.]|uniref:hypothetical protein n=1 Tax=Rubrivirga sp. TaxID=1885344 RepID=UPI003C726D13
MRALLLALLFSTATAAQTESVVVTITPDGYTLATVSDEPVDSDRALLLTYTEEGTWLSRVLSPDDVPSEVMARRRPARFRPASASLRPVTRPAHRADVTPREMRVGTPLQSRVRYSVWLSRLPAASVPSLLADLEDEAPFTRAEVQTRDQHAEVELSFAFSSVGAWAEWTEQAGLEARFANDPAIRVRSTIEVVRPMERTYGEILEDALEILDDDTFELDGESTDVLGDGEIIDDID